MERRRRRRGEDGAPLNWSLSSLLGPLRGRRGSAQGPAASPAQRASDISRLLEATDSDGEGFFLFLLLAVDWLRCASAVL